jgi:TRAP-type C4-dicarboxylate transport system substrate-binding protein
MLTITLISLCGVQTLTSRADAGPKRPKLVEVVLANPLFPEFGESRGISVYVNALMGRAQLHPALKRKVRFRIKGGEAFNSMDKCLAGIASGPAHMSYSAPQSLEQLNPAWKLGTIPGMFKDWPHFVRAVATPPWRALQERMTEEKGVAIVKWLFNVGDLYLFTRKGPPATLEALNGQRIWPAGDITFAKALKNMGADPISLPYTEVATSLYAMRLDGAIADMTGGMHYYTLDRYTKYAIMLPMRIQPVCWVVNSEWYGSLEPGVRKAIQDVFDRIDVSKFYDALQESAIRNWQTNPKLEPIELGEAEAKRWITTMRSANKDVLGDIDPEFIDAIDSAR